MEEPETVRDRLSRAVAAWTAHAHVTPTSLHKQTAISRDAFYRLQGGKGFPALDTLVAFAGVVGTTAARLLDGEMPGETSDRGVKAFGEPTVAAHDFGGTATPPAVAVETVSRSDFEALQGQTDRLAEQLAELNQMLLPPLATLATFAPLLAQLESQRQRAHSTQPRPRKRSA